MPEAAGGNKLPLKLRKMGCEGEGETTVLGGGIPLRGGAGLAFVFITATAGTVTPTQRTA
jgi:hypothetical protein